MRPIDRLRKHCDDEAIWIVLISFAFGVVVGGLVSN